MTKTDSNNTTRHNYELQPDSTDSDESKLQVFNADWDEEGVYFYQAYCDEIADYAIAQQRLGSKRWNSKRMTWIKPSFGWMLYRCGYGKKPGQDRVLRIKLSHSTVAHILSNCNLAHSGYDDSSTKSRCGKVQWDPERDLYIPTVNKGRLEPRKLPRTRAIQIGMRGTLSEFYVSNLISVEDVTYLAHKVYNVHNGMRNNRAKGAKMQAFQDVRLQTERPYFPSCDMRHLVRLGMFPGEPADKLAYQFFGQNELSQGSRGTR
uniref:DUF4291 domain-containing protein n=1 Tax=Pseudo-nitzschia delicatissima TaxID=44447 RepID=A0A7S0UIY9_9STRA|mmetsp:Transcript_2179/g.4578  ORF Transcript_2179/g.4578 Transcript_2179/m.4578 type:complete len:262 (+) Transcript_2179:81-866(+)|eukprot:CAMPEP_0197261962 /NCGR_PEP_ID=MMETSP1432-20130617/250_1 /TAXON_ID=44447 /ORGANISM="Pseudo-nitzschia delicatissima, Strain UNC1205" /LENGTH=261 /DNA_ID=CAMNT_0042726259 /DNA_START=48 /DNA_END=833 /DNA_ORIENTATION=+